MFISKKDRDFKKAYKIFKESRIAAIIDQIEDALNNMSTSDANTVVQDMISDDFIPAEAKDANGLKNMLNNSNMFNDIELEDILEYIQSFIENGIDDSNAPEDDIVEIITNSLENAGYDVTTFKDAGVLTQNKGLVATKNGEKTYISFPGTYQ